MSSGLRRLGTPAEVLKRVRAEWRVRGARGAETEQALVWMLGSPRSGSTWLLNLLTVSTRVVPFDEPGIGYHLGLFVNDVMGGGLASYEGKGLLLPERRLDDHQYFFARAYEHVWRPGLRHLILARMGAQLDAAARERHITRPVAIIKEPTGSQVADFLFTVLPRSRLLFLMRDPRDTLDSKLDSVRGGGSWMAEQFGIHADLTERERIDYLRAQAHRWVIRTDAVQRAYDGLPQNQRHLVRYEALRADTAPVLRAILRWLGLEVAEHRLKDVVDRLAFEALPESAKGQGKFTRSAAPGAWKENLSAGEQAAILDVIGEHLERLGYEASAPNH